MMKSKIIRNFLTRCVLTVSCVLPLTANSAFFQLAENSALRLGNGFAGGAAIYDDASTVWYNPAALTQMDGPQFSAAGHLITVSSEFSPSVPATTSPFLGGAPIAGGNGGDLGVTEFVPNLYYTRPLNSDLSYGLGINAPFGLSTEYDSNWVGRYYAEDSEIITLNINPAVGWKASDTFSIGGGLNLQYFEGTLTRFIDTGSLGQGSGLTPTRDDSRSKLNADDWGFGYNLGLHWNLNDSTKFGLAYRSEIDFELDGVSTISTSPTSITEMFVPGAVAGFRAGAAALGLLPPDRDGVRSDITMPATISLSAFHQVNPKWSIMGDVTQTRWSAFDEFRVEFDSGVADSVLTLGLEDSWRYSIGATYIHDEKWTYRFGLVLDETPVPSPELRTARLPDEERTWLAFGFTYTKSPKMTIDFGYAFITADDPEIRKVAGAPGSENFAAGNLIGTYDGIDVNVLSVQFNWKY